MPVRFLADEDCDSLVVRALRTAGQVYPTRFSDWWRKREQSSVAHSLFLSPAGREYENVSPPILYQIAVSAGVLLLAF